MSVQFQDFSIQVKDAIDEKVERFLYESAELVTDQAAQITPVQTGQLKGSWKYSVDLGRKEAKVGSPLENAIWNEFGTGEHALHGDGRKGGWSYQDDAGYWHHTKGKTPNRTLQKTFDAKKNSIINFARQLFGELGR